MIGIYKITNPKGKIYIGQSININKRFQYYKKLHCKKQILIYRSLYKYGVENHIFEIIEECEIEQLNNRERYWQDFYNVLSKNGLNCVLVENNNVKKILSKETKNKISRTIKNKPESFKKRLREMNIGKQRLDSTKLLISINHAKKKKVICTESKKIWNSLIECCNDLNINSKTLSNKLSDKRKNNTTLTFLKNE